ncbi:hypothetical protein [Roseivirga sp. E12]|uniref:hypothetical protein n=1 Tax=Roseivirga sp. E12 TaxID=2819237 RepID=UPI001ABD2621|nr:hypothetical protein [Roseivirga sp. E12]MBO3700453.1 hypothetical protein [Roseivirga sp. E12]
MLIKRSVFRRHLVASLFLYSCLITFLSCENEEPQPTFEHANRIEFSSNASFLVADGHSTATFNIGFFDEYGRIIENLQARSSVKQNGQVVSNEERVYTFTPETSGSYLFQLFIDEVIVENHIIYVLENQRVEIPVIFHISENESGNMSELTQEFLDKLNSKLLFRPDNPGSTRQQSSLFSFVLAEVDESGQTLAEKGVNRYNGQYEQFAQPIETWQREYYWDPETYVNFWLGKRGANQFVARANFPDHYHFSLPKSTLPEPRWEYRVDYGDSPPTHHPEGIKYGYGDSVSELTDNSSVLNYITLLVGKFMGLEVHLNNNVISETNYMSYYGNSQKDHFTAAQNGQMWFIINYARWRARKGLVRIPLN